MSDTITLLGFVATVPRHIVTAEGLPITSFRLASTQRRFDRRVAEWVDGETNWYTVTGFRQLAVHSAASIAKGDRVLVTGRLRIRDWSSGDRSGTTIEVEAEAIGHDLAWGTAAFTRATASTVLRRPEAESEAASVAASAGSAGPPGSASEDPEAAASGGEGENSGGVDDEGSGGVRAEGEG
jgi:single-strand DNA-binding protein